MLTKVKEIIIFGGGTSGWMTAAFLARNLRFKPKITLIEDATKGPIGVGEGTQPSTAPFLWDCGLHPKDWMKDADATFKYGVELSGWCDEPYFVDNDVQETSLISEGFYTNHYFQNKPYSEYKDFLPAYNLAKENLSPKLGNFDQNFAVSIRATGAFHFNAYKIVDALKRVCLDKITHVDTTIEKVNTNEHGITNLVDKDGKTYSADLYIDCSGFASILLDKTLKVPFDSYTDHLLCDRAVAMPKQYTNETEECHPYTKATTMTAGWRWTIPTFGRIGNGYVYSSKYISEEDAEKELRDAINEYEEPANHLKIRCGKHTEVAVKNVVGVGLSAGFIEPLEATGITFSTNVIKSLAYSLNHTGNILNDNLRKFINDEFNIITTEILAFVWAHYKFSTRQDTDFWKAVHDLKVDDLPEKSKEILNELLNGQSPNYNISPKSMFCIPQWFSMLHAGNAYKDNVLELTSDEETYGKYFVSVQKERVRLAKEFLKNHYEFLKEFYNDNSI